MNDQMQALARRAVACKHWRWMVGMLLTNVRRVCWWTDDGRELLYCPNNLIGGCGTLAESECTPDLDDPATLGCLLALVREAWGKRTIGIEWEDSTAAGWLVTGIEHNEISGDTEAEALVAALEAAP